MKINPIKTQGINTNFKAISLVQVSKKAFANPDNIPECADLFSTAINILATQHKTNNIWQTIKSFFLPTTYPVASLLEAPSYFLAKSSMQREKIHYAMWWLIQNTNLPIKEPLDTQYHSFYVFSQKDKHVFMNTMLKNSMRNIVISSCEGRMRYTTDTRMQNVYTQVKTGVELDKPIFQLIDNANVKEFKLNNLDELKEITKQLDI